MRLGLPGVAEPSDGMARRSWVTGTAASASTMTPPRRNSTGRARIMRTHFRPMVGFSSSGSGALTIGARAAKTFVPMAPRMAGSSVTATSTAMATVSAAVSAMAVRKSMLMIDSATSAMITVMPAKTTAVPALPTARPARCARSLNEMVRSWSASSFGSRSLPPTWWTSSLRKRERMNSA